MKQFISIITIALLFTATACAPEKTEVSCPRPDDAGQILKGAMVFSPPGGKGDSGIYLIKVAPDSFWACAGIQEGSLITEFNSRPVWEDAEMREFLELITQDLPLELSVQDPSGDLRFVVVR